MDKLNQALEQCQKLCQQHSQIQDWEISLRSSNKFLVSLHQSQLDRYEDTQAYNLGLRIQSEGRLGASFTENLSDEAITTLVDQAIANAAWGEESSGPFQKEVPIENLGMPSSDHADPEDRIDLLKDLEKRFLGEAEVNKISHLFSFRMQHANHMITQGGFNHQFSRCHDSLIASVATQDGSFIRTGSHHHGAFRFSELNPNLVFEKALEEMRSMIGATPLQTGSYPILFDRKAAQELWQSFSSVFSAESVEKGLSQIPRECGQMIASPHVTFEDTPLDIQGSGARPFDDEGTPCQTITLIEEGRLCSLLHNTLTAQRMGQSSTGSGVRPLNGKLGINLHNGALRPGKADPLALASENKVFHITSLQGLHAGTNTVSGDFAAAAKGFLLKDGQRQQAVDQVTISGNFYALLSQIEGVANDFDYEFNNLAIPSFLTQPLKIAGK